MNNKGFTLVEVLAVIVLISIIGLIAIPNVISTLGTSKKASDSATYDNIKTALITMCEEIVYLDNKEIFIYDNSGKTDVKVVSIDPVTNEIVFPIVVNIQTLIGYGFLSGVNNDESCINGGSCASGNGNKKVLYNSNGDDLGQCEVSITMKKNGNGKVCYEVSGSDIDSSFCPNKGDFGGDNQCS